MSLPLDLVLVRHGQSEGNAAMQRSRAGDDSAILELYKNRHSASLRLTEKGRSQALQAGKFIVNEFFKDSVGFDRYLTSEYLRAIETAGLLHLPGAKWYCDFYLAERDWGQLEACSETERKEKFGQELQQQINEPFFWRPPSGESFAELCLRVDRVLGTLHRECDGKRVLINCHGEVMRAFQTRIERLSQMRFKELFRSHDDLDHIYNCQVVHYTRKDPESGAVSPYMGWVRWIRPTESPATTSGWRMIERPQYSSAELLNIVR